MKLFDPRGVSIEVSDEQGEVLLASARGFRRREAALKKAAVPAAAMPAVKRRAPKSDD